jgi:hypothetical protein
MRYLFMTLLFIPAIVSAQTFHVAESTVQPERLFQRGHVWHYNYNVHEVAEDHDGERVTMYRYNVVVFHGKPTAEEVSKAVGKVLDKSDAVTLEGKAPACTETTVPDWGEPRKVEAKP